MLPTLHVPILRILFVLTAALALVVAMLPADSAFAADFTVDTLVDTNDATPGDGVCADAAATCSLRAAVEESNALAGADTITVPDLGAPYALTLPGAGEDAAASGDLDVTDQLTITGDGADAVTIDATAVGDRIIDVLGAPLALTGVTLTGGTANAAPDDRGGAIRVDGDATLDLSASVVDANTAPLAGGGIENTGGAVTVTDTDFTNNTATGQPMAGNGGALHAAGGTTTVTGGTSQQNTAVEGGGFWVGGAGTMTVNGTTFDSNVAVGADAEQGGGAIYAEGGSTLDITNATMTANTANTGSGSGGAILATEDGTTATITDSTLTTNTANRAGGGIEVAGATVTVTNTNFTANDVATGAMPGNGGALHDGGGNVTVTGGAVEQNTAVEGGGFWTSGVIAVSGTTFEDNVAAAGGAFYIEEGGQLDLDGVTGTDDQATGDTGDGNELFDNGGMTSAVDTTLTSGFDGLTCNVLVDDDQGGNTDDDGSCFVQQVDTTNDTQIDRIFGVGRNQTAIAVSQDQFDDGEADSVVLSRSDIYPDALAGTPLAVQEVGPLLLTSQTQLDDEVSTEIQRVLKDDGRIYLLGGTVALSAQVQTDVEALGYEVVRYGGTNRFETAVIIATDGLDEPQQVLIADGMDFPDAVAAGAAAAATDGAVVLTSDETVPPETAAYLDQSTVPAFAIGGPAVRAVPSATPVMGADRVATSVEVATTFFDMPSLVGIAQAGNFPDALTGGVLTGANDGPLLLSFGDDLDQRVADYLTAQQPSIQRVVLFGGTEALSQALEDQVTDLFTMAG